MRTDHGHVHHETGKNQASGADKHAGHHTADFLRKFWVTLLLTLPILAYSDIFEIAAGVVLPRPFGIEIAILALGSTVFFYGGWVFLVGAFREIRARLPGMMTLIALAISAAYLFSIFQVLRGEMETLFWELSTLIAIMLLGHWIEMRSVQSAKGALNELAKLLPDTAEVLREGGSFVVPLSELKEGDMVLVKPGAKVPADGEIIEGRSDLNESIITGESKPVSKKTGDRVIAGAINGDGSLKLRVSHIGEKTFLAGVMRLVAEAEGSKSRLQLLSDKAAFWLTVIALVAGVTTFFAWILAAAGVVFATERLVAVLVIACPHALGLAVPLVAAISTTKAAQNGFLIKRRLALEAARSVNVVLFDKTGTLTKGEFGVTAASDEALALAAAVEAHSEHPIGKAIVVEARKRNLDIPDMRNFRAIPGSGVEADVAGSKVFVGHRGGEKIIVEKDGKEIGAIEVADTIRDEAKEAVSTLKEQGLSVVMITGDSHEVAEDVARALRIDEYFARVKPGEKSEKVKLLQSQGKKVAMVGDGVNDAPALTQADLGIAIGAGTNVAIESAGIILVRNDPRDIPKIIKLSKLTYTKMLQNLFWATGYNLVALPLAAGALAWKGVILEPAVAAIFMSLSTVIVALNAILLRRVQL
ncbi:cadmium-translocating P-type ATPase [Candidatus Kaiserbacteria bacterium]|nr:cadmium-translocating P-type ATPase [Candidatus Kaiserbacteria bacterium]